METSLVPPSIDASQNPVAFTSLYNLLTRVQSGQKGIAVAVLAVQLADEEARRRPVRDAAQLQSNREGQGAQAAEATCTAKTAKARKKAASRRPRARQTTPGFPTGYQMMTTPNRQVVITCSADAAVVCPGAPELPGSGRHLLLPLRALPGLRPADAGDERHAAEARRARSRTSTPSGQPIVTLQFNGKGNKNFHRHHARRGDSRPRARRRASTSRSCSTTRSGRSRRSTSRSTRTGSTRPAAAPQITGLASLGEAKNLALVLQTGALPVKFVTVERSDVSATLGQDSLRQARNAAIVGLLLVVIFLLLIYRFLGVVAVLGLAIYAALHVRRDPAARRDADAAGLRRPDPDDRRRGRREHRHLRTHQGGGAVREVREGRDRGGLREGLPHDPRRERRHLHHRARAVRGRDGEREGLRADAADRHRRSRS